jgi:hypothetical protein
MSSYQNVGLSKWHFGLGAVRITAKTLLAKIMEKIFFLAIVFI